jgi:hypothetical protein
MKISNANLNRSKQLIHMNIIARVFVLALLGAAAINSNAALINLGPGSFTPLATEITFSEVPLYTVNPHYNVAAGTLGNVDIDFAGSFVGQTIIGGSVKTLSGSPTGPLTLDGGDTVTVNDGAPGATSPVLSGSPTYNGPISVKFGTPVAAVGLKAGYFNAIGATTIEAFDINGVSLGSIVNSVLGFEFYGLADSGGANVISGISFYITGNEPAGFEIDNLTFGAREAVNIPTAPDGGSTLFLLSSVLGLFGFMRNRNR